MELKIHFGVTLKFLIVLWNCIFKLLLVLFSKDFFPPISLWKFSLKQKFYLKFWKTCCSVLFFILNYFSLTPSLFFSLLIWKQSWKFYETWKLWKVKKACVAFSPSVNKNKTFFLGAFCLWRLTYTELGFLFHWANKKICQQAFLSVRGLKKATANLLSLLEIFLMLILSLFQEVGPPGDWL